MKNNFPNISTILLAMAISIIGGLCAPILHKYYTFKPLKTTEIDQNWTITLTSPNADEYETWQYHGPKPKHDYSPSNGYLRHGTTDQLLKINNDIPQAPIGWYLYITNDTENETLKITNTK